MEFQVIMPVATQADKDNLNLAAALFDPDSYWLNNLYTDSSWRTANGGTHWLNDNPANAQTQLVLAAWLDETETYNSPYFTIFRTGKGIHSGMTDAQFNDFRNKVIIGVDGVMADTLTEHGLTEDVGQLPI